MGSGPNISIYDARLEKASPYSESPCDAPFSATFIRFQKSRIPGYKGTRKEAGATGFSS